MGTQTALILVGIILIFISSVWNPPNVSFWNLGWALVLSGALLVGKL